MQLTHTSCAMQRAMQPRARHTPTDQTVAGVHSFSSTAGGVRRAPPPTHLRGLPPKLLHIQQQLLPNHLVGVGRCSSKGAGQRAGVGRQQSSGSSSGVQACHGGGTGGRAAMKVALLGGSRAPRIQFAPCQAGGGAQGPTCAALAALLPRLEPLQARLRLAHGAAAGEGEGARVSRRRCHRKRERGGDAQRVGPMQAWGFLGARGPTAAGVREPQQPQQAGRRVRAKHLSVSAARCR